MSAVLADAGFLAFTERMYPLERCIIAPRDADEILTFSAHMFKMECQALKSKAFIFGVMNAQQPTRCRRTVDHTKHALRHRVLHLPDLEALLLLRTTEE